MFWGGREGYENLWNTEMKRETDHIAKFFHMCADYAKEIGFEAQFLIEPKPKEPTLHQYDFDAATAIEFLRNHDLTDVFKLNLEGNHDKLIGWDMDEFPTDLYETVAVMWEVLQAGSIGPHGGLNFDAKPRRTSFYEEDLFRSHIAGMDTYAAGLLVADKMNQDGFIQDLMAERYSSYDSGIGKDIDEGNVTLADLEAYSLDKPQSELIAATKSDHLESVKATINNYIIDALSEVE